MKEIKIFKEDIEIDLPKFIDSRALICANSGGGKSYAVRKILEESSGKVLSIILDVEGEFRTLREKYDFLLIGDEGDVPLSMKSAKLLPEKILELDLPTIIDISDLKRNERIKYVKDFLESLMHLSKKYYKPCLIILDEAHLLAGQQEKQDSCSSVIDLMTRGRKRGYCGVLCTQRISKLHKDAVAECNNIMIGRTGLDIDMKRASEILGFTSKQDMLSLRDLDAGEFFVFGTAISKQVRKAKVDMVKTTHPKVGMDLTKKIIPPTDKIKSMLTKLSELPQEAEKRKQNLEDKEKEIIQLKRELKLKEVSKPIQIDSQQLERAKENGFIEAQRQYDLEFKRYQKDINVLKQFIKDISEKGLKLLDLEVPKTEIKLPTISKGFNYTQMERDDSKKSVIKVETPKSKIGLDSSFPNETKNLLKLRAGAMKMLNWLAGAYPESLSKQRLATLSGFSVKGGTFNTYISELKRNNWIEGNKDLVITQEGIQNAEPQEIPSGEELLNLWKSKFRAGASYILETLYRNYPQSMDKETLGIATNFEHTGGTFNTYLSELRRNGLIKINSGEVKISGEFFQ